MKRPAPFSLLLLVFALSGGARPLPVPSYSETREARTTSEAFLLDRGGAVIHELRVDGAGRRLDWIGLADISPALKQAVLQSEDRRFYRHRGVDWLALAAATLTNPVASRPRGASTLTMQLAALLDRRKAAGPRRSWREKWRQIRLARALERSWKKDEILEAYLNLASFRGELQGVAAAARALLDKEPHGLDDADAWMLAALIRSPNAPVEKVAARACALGRSMKAPADCAAVGARIGAALFRPPSVRPRIDLAPHVAAYLLEPYQSGRLKKNLSVASTLDGGLQRFAAGVLGEQLLAIRAQNVRDGAVLVVENRTGAVLAYVGSSGALASARYVDGVRAARQAGSTLKPFLYGLAFERRVLTPASLLDDSATDIAVERGVYRPRNYNERFLGPVTARAALASSLNVPAVRTLGLVGTENFLQRLRGLGFANLKEDDEFYGPALALGSADVSLWALVNAYRALANGGRWSEMSLVPNNNTAGRRVFSEPAAFLVSSILSDRESRSLTFGLEGPLATRFWTAVKTGTSKDMRDNWCVGYSEKYTVGVWVGNFNGEPMWNVSGMSGAAPVWLEIMNRLHESEPSRPGKAPAGVSAKTVEDPALGLSRAEWFLDGTEPVARQPAARPARYKIIYPVEGTVLAVDPDIPAERQKIFFDAAPSDRRFRWLLDGSVLGSAAAPVSWNPRAGRHVLALVDEADRVVDRVGFSVRGGKIKEDEEEAPPEGWSAAGS